MVDVKSVTDFASQLDGVVLARHYAYMCSDPGQALIKDDIRDHGLNRVVVASCSPLMPETTFRQACAQAGLNPFLFQMTNIREHCSWVSEDIEKATHKAQALVGAAVRRVQFHNPLDARQVSMKQSALVVGGGIAGIEAALRLADAGKKVYLVEREASIGGHMAQLYKTFPMQEIGLKCWLGGGAVKVNKKTWYAHLHKGKRYGRMYSINQQEIVHAHNWPAHYWMNNLWEERVHDIDWLIDKFWPVPTWQENWKELYYAPRELQDG